ncbi:MAG: cell division ATPase MinD [Candidatus Aenigmarchaeota archaeon]|nr:cell division ATPase MinD [Candidatus Aenigmarchaeota archaeon]
MTRRILVLSGKGGVGKTSLVSNLAIALAELGENTIAVDANLTTPNLGMHLGLHLTSKTIHDVLRDKVDVRKAMCFHPLGIRVLTGSLNVNKIRGVNAGRLPEVTLSLMGKADYILMDCASSFGQEVISTLAACDEVIVITNPDLPSVTEAFKGIKIAGQEGKEVLGVVINRLKDKKKLKKEDIEEILGVPVLAEIPEDENVTASISTKTPIVSYKPNSPAAKEIKKLACKITGRPYKEERGIFSRIFGW